MDIETQCSRVNRVQQIACRLCVVLVCCGTLRSVPPGQGATVTTIMGRVGTNGGKPADYSGYVVWVEDIPGDFPAPKKHAVMDQKDMRFIPHVLTILAGTTVEFHNSDMLLHNVFSISPVKRFNLGLYPKGHVKMVQFEKPGIVSIFCNVHPEMSAYVVTLKNPFYAVPGPEGRFIIRNVPSGSRTVRCWSEDPKIQERRITLAPGTVQTVDF